MSTYQTILKRRTIRKFSQEPIGEDLLKKYVNAARIAPSAANLQPIKYVIVNTREMTQKIFPYLRWAGYIAPEGNPKPGEEPTAYIAVIADTDIRKNDYDADMGAAVMSIILAAEEDNIGSCWIGSVDHKEVSTLLKLKENQKLLCIIAMGYQQEESVMEEMTTDIKYYKDEKGVLHVPKRKLEDVIISIK